MQSAENKHRLRQSALNESGLFSEGNLLAEILDSNKQSAQDRWAESAAALSKALTQQNKKPSASSSSAKPAAKKSGKENTSKKSGTSKKRPSSSSRGKSKSKSKSSTSTAAAAAAAVKKATGKKKAE